jgi:hypothetical protein
VKNGNSLSLVEIFLKSELEQRLLVGGIAIKSENERRLFVRGLSARDHSMEMKRNNGRRATGVNLL